MLLTRKSNPRAEPKTAGKIWIPARWRGVRLRQKRPQSSGSNLPGHTVTFNVTMSGITLPQSIYQALLAQARAFAPLEACGILAGRDGHVQAFHPMTNTDASADHFMMDPREQFAVVKAVRPAGQEVLAIHHSHPATPARPSAEDIRLAVTPDVVYTILSLTEPDMPRLKGFCIENGVVSEVPVTITSMMRAWRDRDGMGPG